MDRLEAMSILVAAVEAGHIPLSVAVDIAMAGADDRWPPSTSG